MDKKNNSDAISTYKYLLNKMLNSEKDSIQDMDILLESLSDDDFKKIDELKDWIFAEEYTEKEKKCLIYWFIMDLSFYYNELDIEPAISYDWLDCLAFDIF